MQSFFDFVKSLGASRLAAMAAVTLSLIVFFSFLLAPQLIARQPFAEISALATECFHQLVSAPHIMVRLSADIYEVAKVKLEETACARGFEGRLMVVADRAMPPGDCRIEWADGGVIRDQAATMEPSTKWSVAMWALNANA